MGQSFIAQESIVNSDCSRNMGLARSKLQLETKNYSILPWHWRTWDAMQTNLPGTAATDDLEITTGTLGTDAPSLQSGDLKAAGATTRYAATVFALPAEYDSASTCQIRVTGGMRTTVSDTTATVDIEVYETDGGILTGGGDLCTTAAQDINSLTFAQKTFSITSTGLVAADVLVVRIAIAVNDAATGTAVIGCVGRVEVLCGVRG